MSRHYFLVASLPLLRFDESPPITVSALLALCEEWLGARERRAVENACLTDFDSAHGTGTIFARWQEWETNLRNELTILRAQSRGVEPFEFLLECPWVMGPAEMAREAMAAATPLEAEQILDRVRWRHLEELEVGHHFDTAWLVLYSLKLQLLERKALLNKDAGQETFDRVTEEKKEQIMGGESFYG